MTKIIVKRTDTYNPEMAVASLLICWGYSFKIVQNAKRHAVFTLNETDKARIIQLLKEELAEPIKFRVKEWV